jgi:uncharacterized membrane protein
MNRSRLTVALYVLLVFLSGALVGGVGVSLFKGSQPRSPEEFRQRYLAEMRSRLKLTGGQVTQLNAILDATRNQYREFRERHKEESRTIQDEQVTRINAILNADQRAEYEKMRQERDRRTKRREGSR